MIYPSCFPGGKREMDVETMTGGWRLTVNFRSGPPRTETFAEVETERRRWSSGCSSSGCW